MLKELDLGYCREAGPVGLSLCTGLRQSWQSWMCQAARASQPWISHLPSLGCPATRPQLCSSSNIGNPSNLKHLDIGGTSWLNIPLLDLSHCSSLEQLTIDGCYSISDLHLPPSVQQLSAAGCKKLWHLDLTSLSQLSRLIVSGLAIAQLDLSCCSQLKTLCISDCQTLAGSVLVGHCAGLEHLEVHGCPLVPHVDASSCHELRAAICFAPASLPPTSNYELQPAQPALVQVLRAHWTMVKELSGCSKSVQFSSMSQHQDSTCRFKW